MKTPSGKQRKVLSATPSLDPKILFSGMAYDLKIHHHPEYIKAYSLLANGKYLQLVGMFDEWTSQMYESTEDELFRLHQLAALFSKFPFKDPLIDRSKKAIDKFLASEHRCRRMNQKFKARRSRFEPPHMQFMRDVIERVIGREPNMTSILDNCDFGPGASVDVPGAHTSFVSKLEHLSGTPSCIPVALTALSRNAHYLDILFQGSGFPRDVRLIESILEPGYVHYNKITCVPKNAKTDRVIAIEPVLNGYVQKGIDLVLRQKLKRFGRDLTSQALNKRLAQIGSCYGCYATIDLRAASDSIAIELARELLPPDWFTLLNATRSPEFKLPDGSQHRYEKFCSMGNGFCFPLQTLIFSAAVEYAMSRTAASAYETYTVYGDDIILPQGSALLLLEVLRDIGFRHNEDKTFIHGKFRESCGADYFLGSNVRPLYIKDQLALNHEVYPILNALRRQKRHETWQRLFDSLPPRFRILRPYPRDDDSAIDASMDAFMASKYARWNRETQSWNWLGVVTCPTPGIKPRDEREYVAGKLRGNLQLSDTFDARFSERTRLQVKT